MTSVLVLGGYGAVGGHVVERLRAAGIDALAAVSYTHLTLPTNREV